MSLSFFSLNVLATVHMAGAFAILSFLIGHVCMTTTGDRILTHTRTMITGWEEVGEDAIVEVWKGEESAG